MNNTSGQFMPMPKATVAITTQSSLSKEQNCVTIDFFVISSVMLVNNFLSKKIVNHCTIISQKTKHNYLAVTNLCIPRIWVICLTIARVAVPVISAMNGTPCIRKARTLFSSPYFVRNSFTLVLQRVSVRKQ